MKNKIKYTKDNIKEGIVAKVNATKEYSEPTKRVFRNNLFDYPVEVEQNVLEWINGEPISEIDCHGESIKRVMEIFDLDETWFPLVLINFIRFKNTNYLLLSRVYTGLGDDE